MRCDDKQPLVDVWALLGRKARSLEPVRTDDYLSCTESVGLKLRRQSVLEIKLRSKRDASGSEHWTKVSCF